MEVEGEPVGGRPASNFSQKCLKECFWSRNIAIQPRWARCEMAGVIGRGEWAISPSSAQAAAPQARWRAFAPRRVALSQMPRIAAAASKRRPMLLVRGLLDAALDHGGWVSRCAFARRGCPKPSGTCARSRPELTEQGKGVAGVAHGGRPHRGAPGAQMWWRAQSRQGWQQETRRPKWSPSVPAPVPSARMPRTRALL